MQSTSNDGKEIRIRPTPPADNSEQNIYILRESIKALESKNRQAENRGELTLKKNSTG